MSAAKRIRLAVVIAALGCLAWTSVDYLGSISTVPAVTASPTSDSSIFNAEYRDQRFAADAATSRNEFLTKQVIERDLGIVTLATFVFVLAPLASRTLDVKS